MEDKEFARLMQASADLATSFPDGLVYIGGIAVYLHAINQKETEELAETTHDADLYISLVDLSDMREWEDLVSNRRLRKHQLTKGGFEFDIYTERQSSLRVPYDEVLARSHQVDTFRIACLEHLLVLKVGAYEDRRGSAKGEKDARDIVRLAVVMSAQGARVDSSLVLPYWSEEEMEWLEEISKGSAPSALAKGNAHEAKKYRRAIRDMLDALKNPEAKPSGLNRGPRA